MNDLKSDAVTARIPSGTFEFKDLEIASISLGSHKDPHLHLKTKNVEIPANKRDLVNFLINVERARSAVPKTPRQPALAHWWKRGWQNSLHLFATRRPKRSEPDAFELSTRNVTQGHVITLPTPDSLNSVDLRRLMLARRTSRSFVALPMPLTTLSNLLYHGLSDARAGLIDDQQSGKDGCSDFVKAMSFYLIAYDISELRSGIYRYSLKDHSLQEVVIGDYREIFLEYLYGNTGPSTANLTLLVALDSDICQHRAPYAKALLDFSVAVGRYSQQLVMAGTALNLGTQCTPAMKDSKVSELLQLPESTIPHYTLTIGVPKKKVLPKFDPIRTTPVFSKSADLKTKEALGD